MDDPQNFDVANLHILKLASPYVHHSSNAISSSSSKRQSAVSSNDGNKDMSSTSPSTLSADLKHYQDLFGKLRFSYTEQVTKEKFLRAITSDPPEFVSAQDNVELERSLGEEKKSLQNRKKEVKELILVLEEQGRELAKRYEQVQLQQAQLSTLPSEIANLEASIAELQQQQLTSTSSNPDLNLPLQPTLSLLARRENESADLDRQIALLQERLPHKHQEVERLQEELQPLQTRKEEAVSSAQEAQRRRQAGGGLGDELEEKGRWLRVQERGLKAMLEV